MKLNCNNNQLIRIPEEFNNSSSLLLSFEREDDINNVSDFTIFIGDDIIWNGSLNNSIVFPNHKIIMPIGWLVKKYKNEFNNISILLKSEHKISYYLEFQ